MTNQNIVEKTCLKCGKALTWTGRQRRRKYCSDSCSGTHRRQVRHCLRCGKELNWPSKQRSRKYCSNECSYVGNPSCHTKEGRERLKIIGSIGGINSAKRQGKRSKGENQLAMMLENIGLLVKQSVWSIVKGYEIDIFLPDHNIAISYNGTVHREPIYGQGRLNQIKTEILIVIEN